MTEKSSKNPDTSSSFFVVFFVKNSVFPVYGDLRTPKTPKNHGFWTPP